MTESGFDLFWKAWPSSPRKGSRLNCREKWVCKGLEIEVDQILKHVNWIKGTDSWKKDNGAYIPAPLVYLNQRRWDGAEIPEKKEIELNPLRQMEEDRKKAVPMPEEIREKLRLLKGN